jgi:hypothetical protein
LLRRAFLLLSLPIQCTEDGQDAFAVDADVDAGVCVVDRGIDIVITDRDDVEDARFGSDCDKSESSPIDEEW